MENDCMVETTTGTQKCYHFIRMTLHFLILVSFFSFVYSYFSGFPIFFSYNLQFSTLVFPLLAHALDRKYMFLICNGILAFLAKNLKISSSGLNYSGLKSAEDVVKQITELPPILKEATVQENVVTAAEEKRTVNEQEQDFEDFHKGDEEMKITGIVSDWEGEEDDDDDDDDDDDEEEEEEINGSTALEGTSSKEEVNDDSVSTEELNKKFEEFIRKMKEEIRIEAQQQLITV